MTSDRPVSDEELKEIFEITRRKYAQMRWGDATLEGIKAVRAALQSVAPVPPVVIPEIPDGWQLRRIHAHSIGGIFGASYGCSLRCLHYDEPDVVGNGPTWQEALSAACAKAEKG